MTLQNCQGHLAQNVNAQTVKTDVELARNESKMVTTIVHVPTCTSVVADAIAMQQSDTRQFYITSFKRKRDIHSIDTVAFAFTIAF